MFNGSLNTQFQFGDMPTGLTPMPLMDEDEDFLAMLQSTAKPAAIPTMTTANPADLSSNATVLRNVQLSPPSSESSPSPPNHDTNSASNIYNIYNNQDMASRATRSANRDPFSGEPSSKRKQLDDLDEESDEDAPQRKQQHTDGSSSKKSSSKRKSIGGQDDTRLQKRKEQNRAAQRAFRERKERHVKDVSRYIDFHFILALSPSLEN
jgi:AP-1-like factor